MRSASGAAMTSDMAEYALPEYAILLLLVVVSLSLLVITIIIVVIRDIVQLRHPKNGTLHMLRKGCVFRGDLNCLASGCRSLGLAGRGNCPQVAELGAKDCTPEIDTSEIIMDFPWHFPMDVQWHFPIYFHLSVVFSKGLPLVQWMFTGIVQ